ncbi:MAG: MBOAT family protein [Eubacteriales bacterium]|nr:MBOAT family protein [Eubacteriales bacterium]
MLFNSYQFLLFFPTVCLVFFLLPHKLRNPWLLLCSYFFYGLWNFAYLGLILLSTVTTYLCSLWLARLRLRGLPGDRRKMKLLVAGNLLINLGVLFVFKYYGLFALTMTRLGMPVATLNLMLPVGISFYTFQSLGYSIDVYRGDVEPEKNLLIYALFVSFFPQLVAGPIERAANLLPQFREKHDFDYEAMRKGLLLMMWGYFLKLVLADRAAIVVNHIYNADTGTGFLYLLGTLVFSFQIYGDFAGYSMIAIGAAQVMGFRLMRNFRQPYLSQSMGEFWRRWHISLNNWFRDYVYFPLGGSRCKTARVIFNLLVVFLLSGLWHGAAYTFILWGLLNGVYISAERLFRRGTGKSRLTGLKGFLYTLVVFVLVTLAWVPFRASDIGQTGYIFSRIFSPDVVPDFSSLIGQTVATFGMGKREVIALALSIVTVMTVDIAENRRPGLAGRVEARSAWLRWPVYYALLFATLIFGVYGSAAGASAFIYFQF